MMAEQQPTHRDLLTDEQLAEMAAFMVDHPEYYADSDSSILVGTDDEQTVFFEDYTGEEIEQWADGYDVPEHKLRQAFLQAWKDIPSHSEDCDEREGFAPAAGADIVAFELGLLVADDE